MSFSIVRALCIDDLSNAGIFEKLKNCISSETVPVPFEDMEVGMVFLHCKVAYVVKEINKMDRTLFARNFNNARNLYKYYLPDGWFYEKYKNTFDVIEQTLSIGCTMVKYYTLKKGDLVIGEVGELGEVQEAQRERYGCVGYVVYKDAYGKLFRTSSNERTVYCRINSYQEDYRVPVADTFVLFEA